VEANNNIHVKMFRTEMGRRSELDSSKLQVLAVALHTDTQIIKQHIMPIIVIPTTQYKKVSIREFWFTSFVFLT